MDERLKQILALGREYYDKHEFDRAEHYLKQVAEQHRFADVQNMLGVIAHDAGRFEEAQAAFEEALSINPNYTEAALNLAVTYNDLGRYDEAKRIYHAALSRGEKSPGKLDPFVKGKIANLHGQVSQAYVDAGLYAEAIAELRKAIALCGDFADLRLRLANLYRRSGDVDAAQYELEEAVRARPSFLPARIALGVVKFSRGNAAEAIEQWEAVVRQDPENRSAKMYLRMAAGAVNAGPPKDDSGN